MLHLLPDRPTISTLSSVTLLPFTDSLPALQKLVLIEFSTGGVGTRPDRILVPSQHHGRESRRQKTNLEKHQEDHSAQPSTREQQPDVWGSV